MPALACLNGVYSAPEEARVPIWDRGFLFGDAVYEVFRIYRRRCWLEAEHWGRLERSLGEIRIEGVDLAGLRARVEEAIRRSEIDEGMAYIHITRGVALRKHVFPNPPVSPTELVVILPYDDGPTAGRRKTGVGVVTRPDRRWGRCDIKSTNLLANVLACQEAAEAGAIEAVLIDGEGFVTEATHSSLLWVRDGVVEGSPEGAEILPGTTRQMILRLVADEGLRFRESRVTPRQLLEAEEVILSGTTLEVMPVVSVDERVIGNGAPGAVTRRLQAAFGRSVERWLGDPAA